MQTVFSDSPRTDATSAADQNAAGSFIARFSERLNMALDMTQFPSVNAGRYTSLGAKYGTTRQQAHRWCSAQAVPAPHILVQMADDFGVSVDWLFGRDSKSGGVRVPVYRLHEDCAEAAPGDFVLVGNAEFPASNLFSAGQFAVVQNWSTSLDPDIHEGEDLLVALNVTELEDGAIYVLRSSTRTTVRRFSLLPDGVSLHFSRTTPESTYAVTYQIHELHYNATQQYDTEWRQPGVVVVGRIVGSMRNTLGDSTSVISGGGGSW